MMRFAIKITWTSGLDCPSTSSDLRHLNGWAAELR
jgi:hypothetical protein